MKRQNRTVGFLLVVAILLALLVWSVHEFGTASKSMGPTEALSAAPTAVMGPEAMGDPAAAIDLPENSDAKKIFTRVLEEARNCFNFPVRENSPEFVPTVESVQAFLIRDFGPSQKQADRWIAWHLRNHDGRERRLRLEVAEKDGILKRELHHYAVDREGLPIPLEIDPELALNPSDDTINQMLKEGDVFYKEKASEIFFDRGQRLAFVEADGGIAEFEIENKGVVFHCPNLRNPGTCSCSKAESTESP